MEAPFVPSDHKFSVTTNAIRVTPRAKSAKSYLFTLDTPLGSERNESFDEHKGDTSESREQEQIAHQANETKWVVDQSDRTAKRAALVERHQQHVSKEDNSQTDFIIECELCARDLQSEHPNAVIGELRELMDQSRSRKSQLDRDCFSQLCCHLQKTIEGHEQKLRKLEQQLKHLKSNDAHSQTNTDGHYERENEEYFDEGEALDVDARYSSGAKGHGEASQEVTEEEEEENRFLTTCDWLKFGLTDTFHRLTESAANELGKLEDDIDEDIPKIRSVFLSDLVWDDDGDFKKRVDRQLLQYQRMAYKPRNRWSPKITIPQPFNMTIREYSKPKTDTLAAKRIAKLREERAEENHHCYTKPVQIPKSTKEPKFERIMSQKQSRSLEIRQQSKETLKKTQKPFSFYNRDNGSKSTLSLSRHSKCMEPMDDMYI